LFRGVREAATAQPLENGHPAGYYIAGLDWGRVNDYTVLTIIEAASKQVVYMDRFNKVGYSTQRDRIKAACQRFNVRAVFAEANSMGEPNIEELIKDGLPVVRFVTTNASKAMIVDALVLAFEQNEIAILEDEDAIGELESFQQTRLPGGMMRYAAPEGMHDDCVISMALAWWGVIDATAERPQDGIVVYDDPVSISPY
jgi:hypothetical protein